MHPSRSKAQNSNVSEQQPSPEWPLRDALRPCCCEHDGSVGENKQRLETVMQVIEGPGEGESLTIPAGSEPVIRRETFP